MATARVSKTITGSTSDRNCGNCFYWNGQTAFGECRAKSPVSLNQISHSSAHVPRPVWPITCGDDWCGDHKDQMVVMVREDV